MSRTIAVAGSDLAEDYGGLKRALLLFDQLAVIPNMGEELPDGLSWLRDRGIVVNAFDPLISDSGAALTPRDLYVGDLLQELAPARVNQTLGEILTDKSFNLDEFMARGIALAIRQKLGWDAVSFGWNDASAAQVLPAGQNRVLEVALHGMPEPDELTAFEAILEWRSDPDTAVLNRRFKRWLSNIAAGSAAPRDLEDELEYLVDEYRAHMALHRMKASAGIARSVLVTTADVAGKVVSLKWGDAAKALFSIRDRRIALLAAERDAPGRDIAYIAEARNRFR